jgi:hypothetical protein
MEKKQSPVRFTLRRITTEQFAIVDDVAKDLDNVNVNVSIRFGTDPEGKLLSAYAEFKFTYEEKIFVVIETSCHFAIEESSWSSFISGDKMKIDKGFLCHLAMITVGTTRGVLHAKTEGTFYNQFILPTINVTEIIKDDVIFNLHQPA